MARFNAELPNDIIKQIEELEGSTEKMLSEMTEAGAKIVFDNIKAGVPAEWLDSNIMSCLQITKTYKTPSDDGINTKVAFYGYFKNEEGKIVPAPLVANVTEYGRSNSPYPKKPFLRKAFRKSQIEKAMLSVQKKYIKEG